MYALLILIAMFLIIGLVYGIGGFIFTVVWNFLVPVLWHSAPHLSWLHGVAAFWLIGIIQSIFSKTITVKR